MCVNDSRPSVVRWERLTAIQLVSNEMINIPARPGGDDTASHASDLVAGFCCTGWRHMSVLTGGITMYRVAELSVISSKSARQQIGELAVGEWREAG